MAVAPIDQTFNPALLADPRLLADAKLRSVFLQTHGLDDESTADPYQDMAAIEALVKKLKRDAFGEWRMPFERHWQRLLYYYLNNQWITWHPVKREWSQIRTYKWVPKPVTNKVEEVHRTIRTVFQQIELGAIARPMQPSPMDEIAASVADDLELPIREEHQIEAAFYEADFWFILLGNVFLHTWWDAHPTHNGILTLPYHRCTSPTCGYVISPDMLVDPQIAHGGQVQCPHCQGQEFQPAQTPDGSPLTTQVPIGSGRTDVVSPLELGTPPGYAHWETVPYVVRSRWRDKQYYEDRLSDAELKKLTFRKLPADQHLTILRSLLTQQYLGGGMYQGADPSAEGLVEYELWMKPTKQYPEGLVARLAGDRLVVLDEESVPGPLPYRSRQGTPLWPWMMGGYNKIAGRMYAAGACDTMLHKQDQLNMLDSYMLLIVSRSANPIWLEPKGMEVDKFTGMPGLIVRYNPGVFQGRVRPERIPGDGLHGSLFTLREQILQDIETMTGTSDPLKGQKPPGVEAFAALQLLVERAQSVHASPMKERGRLYKQWYHLALELEREYGPDTRTLRLLGPNRRFAFKVFERADLQGNIDIVIEDGVTTPKTALGKRAAIQQLVSLGAIDIQDPDTRYEILSEFGQRKLTPGLDHQKQDALREQDAFEQWARQLIETGRPPSLETPFKRKAWHAGEGDVIHDREHTQFALSDRFRDLLEAAQPPIRLLLEQIVEAHLLQHRQAMLMPMGPAGPDPSVSADTETPPADRPELQGDIGRAEGPASSGDRLADAAAVVPTNDAPPGQPSSF